MYTLYKFNITMQPTSKQEYKYINLYNETKNLKR